MGQFRTVSPSLVLVLAFMGILSEELEENNATELINFGATWGGADA